MICDSVSLSGFHKTKVNSLNVLNFCTNQEYRIVNPCWRCFSVSDGNKNRYCSHAELELLTWRTPWCKYCERAAKRRDGSNTSAAVRTQHKVAQLQVALTNGNDSGSFLCSCHGNRNTVLNVACTWTQRHCLCRLPFPAPVTRARFPANEISMFAQVEERLRGFTTKKCYKDKKLRARRVGPVCRSGTQPLPTPTHRTDTLPPPVLSCAMLGGPTLRNSPGLWLAVCRDSVWRLQRHGRCWAPFEIERRTSEKDQNMLDFRVDPAQSPRKDLKWAQSAVRGYMAWKSQQGCPGSLKWTSGGTL